MDEVTFSLDDLAGSRFPLLEYAPDATVIVDEHGVIRLVNAQTERLFGFYREEMIGKPIEMLIPPRYRDKHEGERTAYIDDPHVRPMGVGLELRGLRKNGSEFPVEVSLSPVKTLEGRFVSSAIRDATDRKTFEERLQELNSKLEEANRAKDRFLATMSHELRTPLNAILGFTGTLLMELPGPINDEQRRQLDIVRSSARHLLSLINDILDLSKIESGKIDLAFTPLRIGEVVDEVRDALLGMAEQKGLTLIASDSDDTLITDRRALHQILLNLANNAIKFTEHGEVRIEVERATLHERPAVAIAVIDTGCGIRPEDCERLFRPFEQIDPSSTRKHEGTGLGLYLSRTLAGLLGGELRVASAFGHGSTFTLVLPSAP